LNIPHLVGYTFTSVERIANGYLEVDVASASITVRTVHT